MEASQLILAGLGVLLGGGTLGTAITLFALRRQRAAQVTHTLAQTGREEAEASKVWTQQIADLAVQMREGLKNVEATSAALAQSMREKAEAEIKARECEAEAKRLEAYAEGLRISLQEEQRRTTELQGRLREAAEGK